MHLQSNRSHTCLAGDKLDCFNVNKVTAYYLGPSVSPIILTLIDRHFLNICVDIHVQKPTVPAWWAF